MSETQGLAMPDAPYTYCYCENKAPYLFIAPLDNEGHPDWSSAHTGRVAICWELKCDFLKPWPRNENGPSPSGEIREWEDQYRECRSAQQSVSRNMQKSQYDRVKVVGADNAVGGMNSMHKQKKFPDTGSRHVKALFEVTVAESGAVDTPKVGIVPAQESRKFANLVGSANWDGPF
ncbi:hypothetical protein CHU98_g933 [Xylaria longipes]|nr:hypothetical protein CHU98_g933 [Xylaria longipes]